MEKVVINVCYGGFDLSGEAKKLYSELSGEKFDNYLRNTIPRDDPILVQVVEQLGTKANGTYAKLKIVDIPDDVEWHIAEYDGKEWVAEDHRTWN